MNEINDELESYTKIFSNGEVSERTDDKGSSEEVKEEKAKDEKTIATDTDASGDSTQEKDTASKTQEKKEGDEYLKKRVDELTAWGHKKNMAYVNAKKKVSEHLSKLAEDGALSEDDKQSILSVFNSNVEDDSLDTQGKVNPFIELKNTLDKEFSVFKKYTKIENIDEKYNSFFYFWPLMDTKEQEEVLSYLKEEEPDVALDKIMSDGTEIYENLYLGTVKQGGIIPYIKSLTSENQKLAEKLEKLEKELVSTTGKIYNRSISSKVLNSQDGGSDKSYADIWKNG